MPKRSSTVNPITKVQTADLLTPEQLAEKLQRSVSTIYYWKSRGEIPYVKHGKRLRFDYNKVIEHFDKKTQIERSCSSLENRVKYETGSSLKSKAVSRTEER